MMRLQVLCISTEAIIRRRQYRILTSISWNEVDADAKAAASEVKAENNIDLICLQR